MPRAPRLRSLLVAALALGSLTACHRKPKTYESVVQLVRYDVADRDEKGNATLADVELEWDPCPGDQIEIVRGGPEFAACMGKHKVGEMLPALVRTSWDERGYYRWDITKVADCERPPMVDDVSSFEKVQECNDVKLHGVAVGFSCNRQPYAELIKICPWMQRN
jgi:hypothetical protein